MSYETCPHCGDKLPLVLDAFCVTCGEPLNEPPPNASDARGAAGVSAANKPGSEASPRFVSGPSQGVPRVLTARPASVSRADFDNSRVINCGNSTIIAPRVRHLGDTKMFRYFCGPQHHMSPLFNGDAPCSLCGGVGPCFQLEYALCDSLSADDKESALGCFSCLKASHFEFWHDTEIGLLDEKGLTHVYNHNQPPPADFPASALLELRRTPQIGTWQQELWLTHCNDFMAYVGTWAPRDFYANAPGGDGRALFFEMTDKDYRRLWDQSLRPSAKLLESWYATYYVFRCLHCGKLRGNWDCD